MNHSLNYDLRLQATPEAQRWAQQHGRAVDGVVLALIGTDVGARESAVLALPGALGGCLLRSAQACHDQALCSLWLSHEPTCANFAPQTGAPTHSHGRGGSSSGSSGAHR